MKATFVPEKLHIQSQRIHFRNDLRQAPSSIRIPHQLEAATAHKAGSQHPKLELPADGRSRQRLETLLQMILIRILHPRLGAPSYQNR
jgi:hypothetical protein